MDIGCCKKGLFAVVCCEANCCCQQWGVKINLGNKQYVTADVLIFLLMISIFVLFSQSWVNLQTINFLEELISHILGAEVTTCADEVLTSVKPSDDSDSSGSSSGHYFVAYLFLNFRGESRQMILIWGSNHTVGPPGGLMIIIRSALTPDQLWKLNLDEIIRRTRQSSPLSYFKRATELLGEELFPLKSKSALRLYIDSLILNHCDECG